jgi:hypothetical protein
MISIQVRSTLKAVLRQATTSFSHTRMTAILSQIPELIQAVSNIAGPKSSVALMLSCKGFFDLLAPLLWENMTGAEILFSLIEGANIVVGQPKAIHIVSFASTTGPFRILTT